MYYKILSFSTVAKIGFIFGLISVLQPQIVLASISRRTLISTPTPHFCTQNDKTYYGLDINADNWMTYYGVGYKEHLNLETSATEVTICMWFYPTRYIEGSIFFFFSDYSNSDHEDDDEENSYTDYEDDEEEYSYTDYEDEDEIDDIFDVYSDSSFVVTFNSGSFAIDEKPDNKIIIPIGRWSYLCFLASGKTRSIYHKGTIVEVTNTAKDFTLSNSTKAYIGIKDYYEENFSGLVANVLVYPKTLTVNEMKAIGRLEVVENGILLANHNGSELNEYRFPFQIHGSEEEVKVTPFEIKACQLLNDHDDHPVLFPEKSMSCKKAKDICAAYGGRIPTDSFGSEINVEQIAEMKSFWVADGENCKKVSKNKDTGKFLVKTGNLADVPFFCIIPKDTVYKFKQSKEVYEEFLLVDPINVYFDTKNTRLRLSIDSGDAKIHNSYYGYSTIEAEIKDNSVLMGRHKWINYYFDSEYDDEYGYDLIAFSVCNTTEFTCSNGLCINMDLICNFVNDCSDGSDEETCDAIGKISGFYDTRLSPAVNKQNPIPLDVHFSLERVIKIDMTENVMQLSLQLTIKWIDPRLNFRNLLPNKEPTIVSLNKSKLLWNPKISIPSASTDHQEIFHLDIEQGQMKAIATAAGSFEMINGYESFNYKGEDVILTHVKSADADIVCNMNLLYYPFDKQACEFDPKLVSIIYPDAVFNEVNGSIGFTNDLSLYENLKFTVEPNPNNKRAVKATLVLTRRYGAFIFNTFLPCFILEIIGLLTLAMPSKSYSDRVTVTLSCLIVMAALFTQVSMSLPTSAEPKLIDIWMFVHVVLLFMMFLVHVLIIYFHTKSQEAKTAEEELDNTINTIDKWASQRPAVIAPKPNKDAVDNGVWSFQTAFQKKSKKTKLPTYVIVNLVGIVVCAVCYILFLVLFFYFINENGK